MRLNQIACKLNVATTAIIKCLKDKGIVINVSPNTKLTSEQCDLVFKIFESSQKEKSISNEIVINDENKKCEVANETNSLNIAIHNFNSKSSIKKHTKKQDVNTSDNITSEDNIDDQYVNSDYIERSDTKNNEYEEKYNENNILSYKIDDSINIKNEDDNTQITNNKEQTNKNDHKFKIVGHVNINQHYSNDKKDRNYKKNKSKDTTKKNEFKTSKNTTINKNDNNKDKNKSNTNKSFSRNNNNNDKKRNYNKYHETDKKSVSQNLINRSNYRKARHEKFEKNLFVKKQLESNEARKLKITNNVNVNDLANIMSVPLEQIMITCMDLGIIVSINQTLDKDVIILIAENFGFEVTFEDASVNDEILDSIKYDDNTLATRAPIVTIMGHVDHGKTSLLDYLRKSHITNTEKGGITQHISAYRVETSLNRDIIFLDTPGHEAFVAMRNRGINITDIIIVIISAIEGVQPQTKEILQQAKLANVPIVFAINKIDKEGANPEKVKEELASMNFVVEDWGGKYQCQCISAKTGEGVNELLEKILFEADVLDLKAHQSGPAQGVIIESTLEKGKGYINMVLIQDGILKVGDMVLAGINYGKVKSLTDSNNKIIKIAGPSTPVALLGLNGAVQVGNKFIVMNNEKEVKNIVQQRSILAHEQEFKTKSFNTLEKISQRISLGNFHKLNIIIKGDVDGSVQALADSIFKLSTESFEIDIIYKSVGEIIDSDIILAKSAEAIIIGFMVKVASTAKKLAQKEKINIKLYDTIYDVIESIQDIKKNISGENIKEVITGKMEVKEIFNIRKVGTIAGCFVLTGPIQNKSKVKVIRGEEVVYNGEIAQLKHFKNDVNEVKTNTECGVCLKNFNDVKIKDIIECYKVIDITEQTK